MPILKKPNTQVCILFILFENRKYDGNNPWISKQQDGGQPVVIKRKQYGICRPKNPIRKRLPEARA